MQKITILVLLSLSTAAAAGVVVKRIPAPEFADTEVATNIAISISGEDTGSLRFSINLQASPSNNVEVAIGHDADGDGCLSLDESDLAVGYDCGRWFVRSTASDAVSSEPVPDSGTFHRVFSIRAGKVDPSWNLVKVTRRGNGIVGESVTVDRVETGFLLKMR